MAGITLQEYTNEVDQLIEGDRYLEALMHLRHILAQHPRSIEAYFQLGKTMLEAQIPELAIDMFRRVLNANPEHLMARIGLCAAYERLDNLNAAIWNLERAFELNPGNEELADELRRLYGRRDGLEPDHVPLNRAGLARLYMRGNLTNRAVEELRALLKTEAQRPDLQVALAEAYWRNDQIVQASDLCNEILRDLPYCLKANLILGNLWINSGQEEGQRYLDRAQEVDIENLTASELFGAASPLQQREVALERLTYSPEAQGLDKTEKWYKQLELASVSVGISEAPPEMSETDMRLVDITASLESQIEIPDWLRELGPLEGEGEEETTLSWMADLGEEEAEADVEVSDRPQEEQAAEDLTIDESAPDWLKQLEESTDEAGIDIEQPVEIGEEEDTSLDWLNNLEAVTEEESATEIPDWLQELAPETQQDESAEVSAEVSEDEVPDWLQDLQPSEATTEAPPTAEASLQWMQEIDVESAEDVEDREPGEVEPPSETDIEEVPEWLRAFSEAEEEEEITELSLEEAEEVPDWLKDLAPSADAEEAPVSEAEDEIPDWLRELESTAVEEAAPSDLLTPTEAEETPDWLQELAPSAEAEAPGVEAPEEGEVPDWLREIESPVKMEEERPEAPSPDTKEETPEWLKDVEAPAGIAEPQETETITEGEVPDWLREIEPTTAQEQEAQAADLSKAEEIPDWLRELEPTESVQTPQAETPIEEETPDWLRELGVTTVDEEETTEATGLVEEQIPDWLQAIEPTAAPVEAPETEAPPTEEEISDRPGEVAEDTKAAEDVAPSAEGFFGWSAFGDEITEAPTEEALAEQAPSIEEAPVVETQEPAEEGLLSGDDALAWLESLAVGKEDELRAQAAEESEARMAEIMGRKPAEPAPEPEAPAEAAPIVEEAPAAEPQEPAEEGLLSGDDALAWLESLASGKEDELRAQAAEESEARMAEIMGRKPAEPAPEPEAPAEAAPIVEEAPATEPQESAEEGLLSGDDALAWLESLASGKEDELRAQAEAESAARVAEIMGRKPAEPAPEPEAPTGAAPAPMVEEAPVAEPQEPAEEGLLSGDDALAWLESLASGKEDELRAQAAADSEARMAEIMGRKPVESKPEPVVETAPAAEAPEEAETPEEAEPEEEAETGEEASEAFGWSAFGDEITEVGAETEEITSEVAAGEPVEEAVPVEEVETAEEAPEAFGWSAFGDEITEVGAGTEAITSEITAEEPVAEVTEPEIVEPETGAPEQAGVPTDTGEMEVSAATAETLEQPLTPKPQAEVTAPTELVKADTEPEEPVAPPTTPEPAPATAPVKAEVISPEPEPPEREPKPAVVEEAPAEEEPAADIDEMREHLKRKRSDHTTRLALARALQSSGDSKEAMTHYERLIKAGAMMDDVLSDLKQYTSDTPQDTRALRTLGDAYMKEGMLEKALEIYNRAMDQL